MTEERPMAGLQEGGMSKHVSISVATGRGVADRWRAQYYESKEKKWLGAYNRSSEETYNKLCALGPNPDIAEVVKIIGNDSWTHLSCAGCEKYVETGVSFRPDFGDGLFLCVECIDEAACVMKRIKK